MTKLNITPGWEEILKDEGLDTLESLLAFNGGECLSSHRRGATFRFRLKTGQVIFIKRDHFTFKKEILKDLFRFRRPAQKTVKERRAFQAVRQAGFTAPEVIAYGTSSRMGLPHQAAFIMLELKGQPLDSFLKATADTDKRSAAIAAAEKVLENLQKLGFNWPDHKPEHFIVQPDGNIALIDLERLQQNNTRPLPEKLAQKQLARFRKLLPKNL